MDDVDMGKCSRCPEAARHYSTATYEWVCCRHFYLGCDHEKGTNG